MKCLEREQLFAYAHGMLETRQAAEVRAHLEACPACRQVVTEYLRLGSALGEWKPVEPSAGFDARVRQAVKSQGEARTSSLWSGLFALTGPRWLAPASLAVLVGAVALGLYRSYRIAGPAAPESPAARISPAAPPAAQPLAGPSAQAVVEKKSAPERGAPATKQEAPSLMPNRASAAQPRQQLAKRENARAGAALETSLAARSEAAPRPYGAVGGAAPSVAAQSNFLARAQAEPETAAKAATPAAGLGTLSSRYKAVQNQPPRALQPVPSVPTSTDAQAQPVPPPPAANAVSAGPMMVAPLMALPAARSVRARNTQAAAQSYGPDETSGNRDLQMLEDFDLFSDFDVLSELPRGGKKVDNRPRELPPEEQARVLANNERFQSLPPERQDRIRENLRRWNALSPEQKGLIRQRQEIFASLSPAQRRQARALFSEWRPLEPARRQAVLTAFRHLRTLAPDEREKYLSSPEVEQRFSPEERNVLEGLSQLLPGSQLEPRLDQGEPHE